MPSAVNGGRGAAGSAATSGYPPGCGRGQGPEFSLVRPTRFFSPSCSCSLAARPPRRKPRAPANIAPGSRRSNCRGPSASLPAAPLTMMPRLMDRHQLALVIGGAAHVGRGHVPRLVQHGTAGATPGHGACVGRSHWLPRCLLRT